MLFPNHNNWVRNCSGCSQLLFLISVSQQQALIIHLVFIKPLFSSIPWYVLSQQDWRISVGSGLRSWKKNFTEREKNQNMNLFKYSASTCNCSIMLLPCDGSNMRHYNETRGKCHTENHKMRRTTEIRSWYGQSFLPQCIIYTACKANTWELLI